MFRNQIARLERVLKVSKLVVANVVYSFSSFAITLLLPYIALDTFDQMVYVSQMIMFATSLLQSSMNMALFFFYKKNQEGALAVYYFLILLALLFLLVLGAMPDNWIIRSLSLDDLSSQEYIMFVLSIAFSFVYLCNKGVNIVSKSFNTMLIVALVALLLRGVGLGIIYQRGEVSLVEFLILLCILPFSWDILVAIRNIVHYCRMRMIKREVFFSFLIYMTKIGIIGWTFSFSDRLFLIRIKGLDTEFASAVAFSLGFVSIVALFTGSLSSYFISAIRSDDVYALRNYLGRLKRILPLYVVVVLAVSAACSWGVYMLYPQLDSLYSWVVLATLIKIGIISYLGLHSLLMKVLDLLNVEIILNLLRIALIYTLCYLWEPNNLLLWYCIVLLAMPLPELLMTLIVRNKIMKVLIR